MLVGLDEIGEILFFSEVEEIEVEIYYEGELIISLKEIKTVRNKVNQLE